MQLNPMVTRPLLVVRLREALPPMAQTEMNSVMEATKNCEFVYIGKGSSNLQNGLERMYLYCGKKRDIQ